MGSQGCSRYWGCRAEKGLHRRLPFILKFPEPGHNVPNTYLPRSTFPRSHIHYDAVEIGLGLNCEGKILLGGRGTREWGQTSESRVARNRIQGAPVQASR